MNGVHAEFLRAGAAFCAAVLTCTYVFAARPQYHLALDGDAAWGGRDGSAAKPAVVSGASKWVDGVSGRALDVSRHAYDQVTALVAEKVPGVSTRHGTVAFWFRPRWNQLDGERHVIIGARADEWRPFRFYMTKGKNGILELSLVEARQVQFLKKDMIKKDAWTHLAFTWNSADGAVCLYQDGKLVERKANLPAFDIKDDRVSLSLQCGDGTDRFKAVVGDGLYDDIMIFDEALAPDEVFILATGSSSVPMRKVAPPKGDTIFLSHAERELPSASPILRFATSGGARFTLSAMGKSRMLSVAGVTDGASSVVSGADTLDLRTGYDLSFAARGRTLVFSVDGAEQGRVELDREIGRIVSMEAAEGVTVAPASARRTSTEAVAFAPSAARSTRGAASATASAGVVNEIGGSCAERPLAPVATSVTV